MPCERNRQRIVLFTTLLLLASCGGLKIQPPGPSTQAILVIPVEVDAKVVAVRHSFYYVYEITKVDDTSFSYNVDIKFPVPNDILIIDSLPPGDYFVRKFTFLPIGTGGRIYGNNSTARYDLFSLESGKITIFSKSLKLILRNQDPGRFGTIIYNFDILPVSRIQRETIIATLGELQHFDLWEIQGDSKGSSSAKPATAVTGSLRAADGKWKGIWWPVTRIGEFGIECKGGEMEIAIEGINIVGQVTTDDGLQFEFTGNQYSDGDLRGSLYFGNKYYARVIGEVSAKQQFKGEIQFNNECRSEWDLTRIE